MFYGFMIMSAVMVLSLLLLEWLVPKAVERVPARVPVKPVRPRR